MAASAQRSRHSACSASDIGERDFVGTLDSLIAACT